MILTTVLDIDMCATLLGVTKEHARVIAQREQWRRHKIGRRTVYHYDDVDATLQHRSATRKTTEGE